MQKLKIKKIILSCFTNELFWVLLLSFTFRNLYHSFSHFISYNSDTVTYYYAAQHIFEGVIDPFRTPVYPMIIKLVETLTSGDLFVNITFVQHIISFASIIPFYFVCKQWFHNKYIAFATTLLYSCLPQVINYNYSIYPESILLSSLVFFLYLFSRHIVKPTIFSSIGINLYVFYLVMLKPGCAILYAILGFIWILKLTNKKDKSFIKSELLGFAASLLLLLGYCQINSKQNNWFGISTVSHDNNFINVVISKAYKTFPDKKLVSVIDTIKRKGRYYTAYYLNNDYELYKKRYAAFPSEYPYTSDMASIARVPSNELGYTRDKVVPYVKEATHSKIFIHYTLNKFTEFTDEKILFFNGYMVYLLLVLETILVLYFLIFDRKFPWIHIFSLIAAAGFLVSVLIAGINDSTKSRVLIPMGPFLLLLLSLLLDELFFRTLNRRLIKISTK